MHRSIYQRGGKRLLDLLLVVPLLLVFMPLLALVALLVRVRLGAPILFRQTRPGRHGRPFVMLKFRTMHAARDASGNLLPDAARLTPLGRRLRATSLDELPELWNVLRGEMSLVGPRPLLMEYLTRYSPRQAQRHEVRPGITGLAQVSGRNELDWPARLELDAQYVESLGLRNDLWILLRTLLTVLRRDGISAAGHATMSPFEGNAAGCKDELDQPAASPVIVLGAGGHAKVVVATLRAAGWTVDSILDDDLSCWGGNVLGAPITGPISAARLDPQQPAVIAIGDNSVRRRIAESIGLRWISAIHPSATVHESVRIGAGSVVCAGVVVQPETVIGAHVILNTSSHVDHDGRIGDFVHIAPGAARWPVESASTTALLGLQRRAAGRPHRPRSRDRRGGGCHPRRSGGSDRRPGRPSGGRGPSRRRPHEHTAHLSLAAASKRP